MLQYSILGILLFSIVYLRYCKDVGSIIRLLANDTSLFIIVDNPTTAALCLNSDIEKNSLVGLYLVSHFQSFQK